MILINAHTAPPVLITVQKNVVIKHPDNSTQRVALRSRSEPYTGQFVQNGAWLVIPEKDGYGLDRRTWLRHWQELTVEIQECRGGTWKDVFTGLEPAE